MAAVAEIPGQNTPQEDTSFFVDWGIPGEPGSYHVWFDQRGASVWSIWLKDHFRDLEARRKAVPERDDYYRPVRNVVYRDGSPDNPFLLLNPAPGNNINVPLHDLQGQERVWEVQVDGEVVSFRLEGDDGLVLEKIYRPRRDRREFELEIRITTSVDRGNDLQRLRVDLGGMDLWNPTNEKVIGNPAVAIAQQGGPDGPQNVVRPAAGQGFQRVIARTPDNPIFFAGTTNRFFANFFYPLDADTDEAFSFMDMESLPRTDNGDIEAYSVPRARYRLNIRVPQRVGQSTSVRLGCYLGPKSFRVFDEAPEYQRFVAIMDTDLTPPCFCTIPGATFLAGVLLKLLSFFQGIVVNWGGAIIMLTLLVRGALVPLNFRMQKSMRAFGAKMARLKPEMDAMKKRYEKDPKAYQRAMMEFNKKHKVVPPIGGCLPIFLTMPVWIGLFTALRVSYDLRHQPFMLWVDDLSRPDALFDLGLSWLPHFNLLPLIMMGLWYWAQSSTPLPTDPQQRQMMKIMRFMPFIIGIMLYNYASGLMLYMITSSAWALVEMRITRRLLGPMPAAGGIAPMTPM